MLKFKSKLDKLISSVVILLIIVIVILLAFIGQNTSNKKIEDIYSSFTCSCCDGSILETDDSCLMAGGMQLYIDNLARKTTKRDDIMLEAVKKFGVASLIDEDMKIRYGLLLLENTENTPNITFSETEFDLGIVSNSKGIIIVDYKMKNEGTADLIVYDVKTSCACLTTSFIKDGDESVRAGRFSHSQGWTFILKPGEEALLRGYFDPRVTNWQTGHVERFITITSNDPIFYEAGVKFSAELIP